MMLCSVMNESIFAAHIFLMIAFTVAAARLGSAALSTLIALYGILANLFVVKQMTLFGLTVTCSDVFAVGTIFGLNLLQEYFGVEAARSAIKISFFSMVFFVLASQAHLCYLPASVDQTQPAFVSILSQTPRIVFASIAVYFLVQKIDVALFGHLKKLFRDRFLALRLGISLLITQGIDTVLFTFAALYGLGFSLGDVIVVSFTIKCLVIGCSAPLGALSSRFLKRSV